MDIVHKELQMTQTSMSSFLNRDWRNNLVVKISSRGPEFDSQNLYLYCGPQSPGPLVPGNLIPSGLLWSLRGSGVHKVTQLYT